MSIDWDRESAPKWLRALGSDHTGELRLTTGALELVGASVRAAAGRKPHESDRPHYEKWARGVSERLGKLPGRARFTEAQLAVSAGLFAVMLSNVLSKQLSDLSRTCRDPLELLLALGFAPPDSTTTGAGTPADPLTETWASPHGLLRLARARLYLGKSSDATVPSDSEALIAGGIASAGLMAQRSCDLCFRWAVPGRSHCSLHTQSKDAVALDERGRAYVHARRVAAKLGAGKTYRRLNSLRDDDERAFVIGRLMWGTLIPDAERTARAIQRKLADCPKVLALIAEPLPSEAEQLFELLRMRLDPYELRPGAWLKKIEHAAHWLETEITATPTKRSFGKSTEKRLAHAAHLAAKHRVPREDMPLAVGISKKSFEALLMTNLSRPAVLELLQAWKEAQVARDLELQREKELTRDGGPYMVRTKFGAPLVQYDESMFSQEDLDSLDPIEDLTYTAEPDELMLYSADYRPAGEPPINWRVWPTCGCPISEDDRERRAAYSEMSRRFWWSWDDAAQLLLLRAEASKEDMPTWADWIGQRLSELVASPRVVDIVDAARVPAGDVL